MTAVSCVAETYVVNRSEPFHLTTELGMNLLPLTVSMKSVPPAGKIFGLSGENGGIVGGTGPKANIGTGLGFCATMPDEHPGISGRTANITNKIGSERFRRSTQAPEETSAEL
jgi:hypothetical protein